jgi:hypothetical protein
MSLHNQNIVDRLPRIRLQTSVEEWSKWTLPFERWFWFWFFVNGLPSREIQHRLSGPTLSLRTRTGILYWDREVSLDIMLIALCSRVAHSPRRSGVVSIAAGLVRSLKEKVLRSHDNNGLHHHEVCLVWYLSSSWYSQDTLPVHQCPFSRDQFIPQDLEKLAHRSCNIE